MRRVLMLLVVAVSFLFPPFVSAEIFKWVDEKGTVHFTEDPATIPEINTEKTQSRTTEIILDNPSKQLEEDERIKYYYRDPRPNELIPILESILREKDAISNSKTIVPLMHFFATAFQRDLDKVNDLKILQKNYSGEARSVLQALIEEVKNYRPADLKSPEDLELLWSEYKASGNKEIIDRLITVITATTPPEGNNLQDPVKQFLIKIAPYHFEVCQMLGKRFKSSMGNEKNLIGEIVSKITHFTFEPANEHAYRGLNLYYEKKYNEALQEFNKALSYFPDDCGTYMNIANIYDDQNDMQKAIKAGKRAVSIEPDNPGALANLALYYYRANEEDEAIKWYQKCLEYDPKKIDCHYGLAITYAKKRDNDKAVIHLKKYLGYAPNGKHAAYAKQFLASHGQTVEEDPTNVAVMLQNKRYDVLEKHLLSLLRGKNKDKDGKSSLFLAYEKLCNVQNPERSLTAKIVQLKSWLTQNNSSHFANACLGRVYINYAWEARGTGFANTVTEEGHSLFKDRLRTAREYLEKAYSLDQSDPHVPAYLITVARGLGLERAEVEKQFKRAISADPRDKQAYSAKLQYLMPKWYGSEEEMFSFAREAAKKAPADSRIPAVLAEAHWEMYYRSDPGVSYFRNPKVWKEMKEVYLTLSERFPNSNEISNWFAETAYLAGDYDTAREEFKKIGDDWLEAAWGNKKSFEEAKRELFGN